MPISFFYVKMKSIFCMCIASTSLLTWRLWNLSAGCKVIIHFWWYPRTATRRDATDSDSTNFSFRIKSPSSRKATLVSREMSDQTLRKRVLQLRESVRCKSRTKRQGVSRVGSATCCRNRYKYSSTLKKVHGEDQPRLFPLELEDVDVFESQASIKKSKCSASVMSTPTSSKLYQSMIKESPEIQSF